MADAKAHIQVEAEVRLMPDEKTRDWLVSLGWTPPKEEEDDERRHELSILYYTVVASMIAAGKEDLDKLLTGLGVDMGWLLGPPLVALTGAEAWDLQEREREAQRDGN